MRKTIAFLALSALAMPVWAQDSEPAPDSAAEAFERGCSDDGGTDRCDPAVQSETHALYGIAAPSDLLAEGVIMRRAMFVDGYGKEIAAITFWREPGQSPMVEIRSPLDEDGGDIQPLRAAISGETWADVLSASTYFDRGLTSETPPYEAGDTPPPICLHAWFATVEAVDAPRVRQNVSFGSGNDAMTRDPSLPVEVTMTDPQIRTVSQMACSPGLAMKYAFELAEMALDVLPECSSLDPEDFRNEAQLLGLCHQLGGDRLVAGEASVIPRKLRRAIPTENAMELGWLFVGSGNERSDGYLAAIEGGYTYFDPPVGIDADHAVITGQVVWGQESGPPLEEADLTLNLLRVTGDFVIDTFEVTNRRPYERQ